jgi:hypothetical protein
LDGIAKVPAIETIELLVGLMAKPPQGDIADSATGTVQYRNGFVKKAALLEVQRLSLQPLMSDILQQVTLRAKLDGSYLAVAQMTKPPVIKVANKPFGAPVPLRPRSTNCPLRIHGTGLHVLALAT